MAMISLQERLTQLHRKPDCLVMAAETITAIGVEKGQLFPAIELWRDINKPIIKCVGIEVDGKFIMLKNGNIKHGKGEIWKTEYITVWRPDSDEV